MILYKYKKLSKTSLNMNRTIKKHLVIPEELLKLSESKAANLGFNFAQYVRFLLAKEVENNWLTEERYPKKLEL